MTGQVSDNVKPWTIRGIPPEERNAAGEAAKRDGSNLGDWLRRAIRTQIQEQAASSRLPVPVRQEPSDTAAHLSDVERIASSIRDLAAAGVPVPKAHAVRVTRALVNLLPPRPRKEAAHGGPV